MSVVVKTCCKCQRLYFPHFIHDCNVLDTSLIPSTLQSSDRAKTVINTKQQNIRPNTTEIDDGTVSNEILYSTIIGAVLKYPAYRWDHRLPLKDRTEIKKRKLWELVHLECGGNYDVPSIISKWKYLRDKYAREKKNYKRPSGSGSTQFKVWEHFEELKFLEDIVAVEPTTSSNLSLEMDKSSPTISNASSSRKRKTHDVIGEAILSELISSRPKTPPPTTTPTVTDPFCAYLMDTMKDLPNSIKTQLQEDILALVFAEKKKHRSKD
ncbi:uncharacterized protein LOC100571610 [Acyrthosiphon pisum]|uniref:MADF domain-containing protein n=1 Tax=Acyrthosiphon pisum TaxID=7029 RepID=A0A8R1W6S4_ACYPI|nr:uncharacterized protein LOC100571610 [Acyrthosiphon pisum]|eukprot:XP_003240949.1 PREDICTED: uncharacterized protein LOC100571610 [Acyrthosiphon pisum]